MVTSVPIIPEDLDQWNLKVLDSLLKIGRIESETFDFKGPDFKELNVDICAMANTSTGIIVLGISPEKKSGRVIGYQKVGFSPSEGDNIHNSIGNAKFNVEPMPDIKYIDLEEIDSSSGIVSKFYSVLKIEGKDIEKPYFVKGKGQCYVRAGPTSTPASRTTVLNLYSNLKQKQNNLERFYMCVNLLKESIMFTTEALEREDFSGIIKIAPINLNLVKNAMASVEWFLVDNDLLGGHIETNYIKSGRFYSYLQELELLNIYINAYNVEADPAKKDKLKTYMAEAQFWNPGTDKVKHLINFLNTVEKKAQDFLYKFK
jgi:hypothetical protein